jgi:hypothetical protein
VSLTPDPDDLDFGLDLDSQRSARAEVTRVPFVVLNGERHELPVELPLDVLEPLTGVNVDISLLIRQVLDARATGEKANEELLGAIVDMLIVNPKLPTEVVDAVKEMARRLLGAEGYAALVAFRPTTKDVGSIAKYVLRQYGVGLGEASPSSASVEGTGTTSKPTSRGGTTGTSATSGGRRRTRAS